MDYSKHGIVCQENLNPYLVLPILISPNSAGIILMKRLAALFSVTKSQKDIEAIF
jgi:hypothetical protein